MNTAPIRLMMLTMICLAIVSCKSAPTVYEDPMAVMKMSDDPRARMDAARQAEARFPDDPRRITALQGMLWEWGRPHEERQYAIEQLLEAEPEQFPPLLARRILMVKNPQTIAYISQLAADRKWQWFTPALVRSWARPMPGNMAGQPRPEVEAIKVLNPDKPLVEIVFDVFANTQDQSSIHEQAAAWRLLWDIADYAQIRTLLGESTSTTPLVVDLKAAAADLHCLPVSREGILRLMQLRKAENAAWWSRAKELVAGLSPAQQQGLSLRHMPILMTARPASLTMTKDALASRLDQRIDHDKRHLRGPTFDGPMSDYPQRLSQGIDQMSWADLLTIDVILDAIASRDVQAAFFTQADADHQDDQTEYGGVLGFSDDGSAQAKSYAPLYRKHDLTFVPADEMIQAMYKQLAHYHFHAQHEKNDNFAGPGLGDLRMAKALETHCIVLTFIDRDTLNVDYYQDNGVVVDLGEIKRPGSR